MGRNHVPFQHNVREQECARGTFRTEGTMQRRRGSMEEHGSGTVREEQRVCFEIGKLGLENRPDQEGAVLP